MGKEDFSELHLRRIVRQSLPARDGNRTGVWWIEPGSGSTSGLPDLIFSPGGGRVAMVELKRMQWGGPRLAGIVMHLRASQARIAAQALACDIPFIVLGTVSGDGFPLKVVDRPALVAHRVRAEHPIAAGRNVLAVSHCKVVRHHRNLGAAIKGLV